MHVLTMLGGLIVATAIVYGIYKLYEHYETTRNDARKYRESQKERKD